MILGRQFQYDRALEIIQEEEYLEDADFDDIKRYYILKKIGNINPNFNVPKSQQNSNWMSSHRDAHRNIKYSGKYSKDHYE